MEQEEQEEQADISPLAFSFRNTPVSVREGIGDGYCLFSYVCYFRILWIRSTQIHTTNSQDHKATPPNSSLARSALQSLYSRQDHLVQHL